MTIEVNRRFSKSAEDMQTKVGFSGGGPGNDSLFMNLVTDKEEV